MQFALGNYKEAQVRLGKLLTDRKLGTPTVAREQDGQTRIEPNDQYWEATLKLLRSNAALAAANPGDPAAGRARAESITYLKSLYVREGRSVGGPKWSAEFEKLRAELIPDFNPADVQVDATPTTQPAP